MQVISISTPRDRSDKVTSRLNINNSEEIQGSTLEADQGQSQQPQNKYINLEMYRSAVDGKDDDAKRLFEVIDDSSEKQGLSRSDVLEQVTPIGNTLLHIVSSNGKHLSASMIASQAPSLVTKQNLAGDTALHVAARAGHSSVVTALLPLHQDLRVQNHKGNTVLHEFLLKHPIHTTDKETLRLLIEKDPSLCYLPNKEGKTPLYIAAQTGKKCWLTDMLDATREVQLNLKTQPKSPLVAAIMRRDSVLSDLILEKEAAFINLQDEDGKTPLHHASSKGYIDMVQYLLGKSPDCVLVRDNSGFFPAHWAAAHGHIRVIQKLLNFCLHPIEMVDSRGRTILHVAAINGKEEVVCFILQTPTYESLINAEDYEGNTSLHLATMRCKPKVVSRMTWDNRVDLEAVNNEGKTALVAALDEMATPAPFKQRLTWLALRAAGANLSTSRNMNQKSIQRCSSEPKLSNTKYYKDRVNTLLLVSTLVATVTFAAGFTIPGGLKDKDPNMGMANFLSKKAFYVFVFGDTIALYSSILVDIILLWAQLNDIYLMFIALKWAIPLLGIALVTMSTAFMAGVYLVVSQLKWLANSVFIMGSTLSFAFFLLWLPLWFPLNYKHCLLRYVSHFLLRLLMLVTVNED